MQTKEEEEAREFKERGGGARTEGERKTDIAAEDRSYKGKAKEMKGEKTLKKTQRNGGIHTRRTKCKSKYDNNDDFFFQYKIIKT